MPQGRHEIQKSVVDNALKGVTDTATILAEGKGKKTVTLEDIVYACKNEGHPIYVAEE